MVAAPQPHVVPPPWVTKFDQTSLAGPTTTTHFLPGVCVCPALFSILTFPAQGHFQHPFLISLTVCNMQLSNPSETYSSLLFLILKFKFEALLSDSGSWFHHLLGV